MVKTHKSFREKNQFLVQKFWFTGRKTKIVYALHIMWIKWPSKNVDVYYTLFVIVLHYFAWCAVLHFNTENVSCLSKLFATQIIFGKYTSTTHITHYNKLNTAFFLEVLSKFVFSILFMLFCHIPTALLLTSFVLAPSNHRSVNFKSCNVCRKKIGNKKNPAKS